MIHMIHDYPILSIKISHSSTLKTSPLVPLVPLPSRYGLLHKDGPCAVHEEEDVAIAEEIHGALQGAMRQEQQASELSPKKCGEINGNIGISEFEFGNVYVHDC